MKTIIITITAILLSLTINAQNWVPPSDLYLYSSTQDSTLKIYAEPINDKDTLYYFHYLDRQRIRPIDDMFRYQTFDYAGKLNDLYNLFKTQLNAKPDTKINITIYEDEVGTIGLTIITAKRKKQGFLKLRKQKYIIVRQCGAFFELTPTILNTLFKR